MGSGWVAVRWGCNSHIDVSDHISIDFSLYVVHLRIIYWHLFTRSASWLISIDSALNSIYDINLVGVAVAAIFFRCWWVWWIHRDWNIYIWYWLSSGLVGKEVCMYVDVYWWWSWLPARWMIKPSSLVVVPSWDSSSMRNKSSWVYLKVLCQYILTLPGCS